jgi:hypothetical protein
MMGCLNLKDGPRAGGLRTNSRIKPGEEEVPLSEEELRLLEQMERALVEEDPKFASALRGTSFRRSARRRAIVACIVFVLGIGILMAGAILRITPLGIAGFVVMLLSATVGLTAIRGHRAAPTEPAETHPGLRVVDGGRNRPRRPRRPHPSHSFMERMEERWRRRRDNGGF